MWIAQMDSEHYTWTALGESEQGALDALALGWERHARQNPDVDLLPAEALEYYAANAFELEVGECARDYDQIKVPS